MTVEKVSLIVESLSFRGSGLDFNCLDVHIPDRYVKSDPSGRGDL